MFLHGLLNHLNGFGRGLVACLRHQLQNSSIAEELLLGVLGLVQSVGIYQQQLASDVVDGFTVKRIVFPQSEWLVGVLHRQETGLSAFLLYQYRGIMAAVAEIKTASL